MMPKDIKREFLTGPRHFHVTMEQLEIIINEMMADQYQWIWETLVRTIDQDMSSDMSYDDVCAIAWKEYKAGKGASKEGPIVSGTWNRERGADEWTRGRRKEMRQETVQGQHT